MFSFNAAVTAIWSSPTYAGSVPRDNKFHVYTLADTHTHACMQWNSLSSEEEWQGQWLADTARIAYRGWLEGSSWWVEGSGVGERVEEGIGIVIHNKNTNYVQFKHLLTISILFLLIINSNYNFFFFK